MDIEKTSKEREEKPLIFKSWNRLYLLVLLNLIFCLTVFYIIRRIFE
jgi:sugar phosphate permease